PQHFFPNLTASMFNATKERANPFRIRSYAKCARNSFRIRSYDLHRGVGVGAARKPDSMPNSPGPRAWHILIHAYETRRLQNDPLSSIGRFLGRRDSRYSRVL